MLHIPFVLGNPQEEIAEDDNERIRRRLILYPQISFKNRVVVRGDITPLSLPLSIAGLWYDRKLEIAVDWRWPLSCVHTFSDDGIFGPAC